MSYKINKYPDGTSYVTIPKEWEGSYQEILFKVNNYTDFVQLLQLCDVLTYNRVNAHIIIPCLLDAQADKRFDEFQSSGLRTLVEALNNYKELSFGVFHPHNPEVVEALFHSVETIDNSEFIRQVKNNIQKENSNTKLDEKGIYSPNHQLVLMSSDAGGFKPLMKLCDKIGWKGETYSASKSRKYEDGKSSLSQIVDRQDFEGKDILIVDDISVYGGTFKGLSKLLKKRNCGKLYLAVSHMTVQDLGQDPVTDYFDKVFTTNSKFDSYYFEEDLYLQSDDEGNEYMKKERAEPLNLEIIKLF